MANPAVIRANIPEQGRLLTFKRAVVVDTWADLNIGLKARTASVAPWTMRLLVLAITALVSPGLACSPAAWRKHNSLDSPAKYSPTRRRQLSYQRGKTIPARLPASRLLTMPCPTNHALRAASRSVMRRRRASRLNTPRQ